MRLLWRQIVNRVYLIRLKGEFWIELFMMSLRYNILFMMNERGKMNVYVCVSVFLVNEGVRWIRQLKIHLNGLKWIIHKTNQTKILFAFDENGRMIVMLFLCCLLCVWEREYSSECDTHFMCVGGQCRHIYYSNNERQFLYEIGLMMSRVWLLTWFIMFLFVCSVHLCFESVSNLNEQSNYWILMI